MLVFLNTTLANYECANFGADEFANEFANFFANECADVGTDSTYRLIYPKRLEIVGGLAFRPLGDDPGCTLGSRFDNS